MKVEVAGIDREVGGHGISVEVQREIVGRKDLAEGDGGSGAGNSGREPAVHPEALEFALGEDAERVLTRPRGHAGPEAVSGGSHGDVGGAAAQKLAEGGHILQAHTALEG